MIQKQSQLDHNHTKDCEPKAPKSLIFKAKGKSEKNQNGAQTVPKGNQKVQNGAQTVPETSR